MKTLPQKPSDLIRLAITDLELCEKDPRYMINMYDWHDPRRDACSVCLAGAVMAKELNTDPLSWSCPQRMGDKNERPLIALNYFRVGAIQGGVKILAIDQPSRFKTTVSLHGYEYNPKAFKADMLDMARQFERVGL